jgi:DNA-binding PadR family transcriptional regulator
MRLTPSLTLVVQAFLHDPSVERHGYDLMQTTGLASGSLYPILGRLLEHEVLVSRWDLPEEGARPRRYYQLTERGAQRAADWLRAGED